MTFWQLLWTITWFAGTGVFVCLSAVILANGAKDVMSMLRVLSRSRDHAPNDGAKRRRKRR